MSPNPFHEGDSRSEQIILGKWNKYSQFENNYYLMAFIENMMQQLYHSTLAVDDELINPITSIGTNQ